jgi:hypothetical protein
MSGGNPATGPASLGLVVELRRELPDLSGVCRLVANLLSSAPSKAPRTRAPSLHQHYPASSVLWAPPTPTSARPLRPVEGQRPPRLRGPPVLRRALSLRAVPTTPASHPEPGGCPGPGYSGLPRVKVGSALATSLSGPAQGSLAFGPQTCWPSYRELLSGRLDDLQLPEDHPPVATRLYRQLPRQDFHLLDRATFARRTLTVQGFRTGAPSRLRGHDSSPLSREPQPSSSSWRRLQRRPPQAAGAGSPVVRRRRRPTA